MKLAPYNTSTNYGELYDSVQKMEVVGIFGTGVFRAYCNNGVVWVRGGVCEIIKATTKEDFISQCEECNKECNLEWIVPEGSIKNCMTCALPDGTRDYIRCQGCVDTKGRITFNNWRPKEGEGE